MDKKTLTIIFFGISIFLLISNIIIDELNKVQDTKPIVKEAYIHQIDSAFTELFERFGFNDDWVQRKAIKSNTHDSLKFIDQIKFPTEIALPLFLADIQEAFNHSYYSLEISELQMKGKTRINIFSNKKLKYQGFLNPDTSIKRIGASFSFLITDIDEIERDELEVLDTYPFPVCVLLLPSKTLDEKLTLLNDYKSISYSILIDEDISDDKYKISPSNGENSIKASIYSIYKSYPNSNKFIYINGSGLSRSIGFSFIKSEFQRYGIELVGSNTFEDYTKISQTEIRSLFKFLHESGQGKETKNIMITTENLNTILDQIKDFKRSGDKIVRLN